MSVRQAFMALATAAHMGAGGAAPLPPAAPEPARVDMRALGNAAPAPPITPQQALVGPMAQFTGFLNQLSATHWPQAAVGMAGTNDFMSVAQSTRTMQGFHARYATSDGGPLQPANVEALTGLVQGQIIQDMLGSMFVGNRFFALPSAMAVNLEKVPGLPKMGLTVMGSNACTHCLAPAEIDRHTNCDMSDPNAVRLSQFTRMFTGLHEYMHVIEPTEGLANGIMAQAEKAGKKLHAKNVDEALADSGMALLAVKLYGDEGRAMLGGWLHDRTAPTLSPSHYTAPTLVATLAYIDNNPAEIQRMNPAQLLRKARDITQETALTVEQATALENYKLNSAEPKDPALKPVIDGYKNWQQQREQLAASSAERIVALNPLNSDPHWKAEAQLREQSCRAYKPPVP